MKFYWKIFFLLFAITLLISYPLVAEEFSIYDETESPEIINVPEGLKVPEGMVYVPDGYFIMGSNDSLIMEEKPAHQVYTKGFFIDKYEVSNRDYEIFLYETGHPIPKYWYDERFNDPDYPVVGVSWDDAVAYALWAKKRLPTEAEWEKAARGTKGVALPWGNDPEKIYLPIYLNIHGVKDNFEYTSPVDHFILGISPFKAFNMVGNVWEWCQDWFDPHYYKYSQEINPLGPKSGMYKVLRGGSWVNKIYNVSTTKRIRNYPKVKLNIYGFRCAKSIP